MPLRSVRLARIFGIRIGADPSWFLVLFVMIVLLSQRFAAELGTTAGSPLATGIAVAATLLFFLSLTAHELGHALVARRFGIETQGIDLWLLGGVAKLSRDSRSAREEFWIAIAGPIVTVVIALAAFGAGYALSTGDAQADAALFETAGREPLVMLLGWLAVINGLLFAFNMLPAFPLDGGRVARAIVWAITKDRRRATRFAGGTGRVFGLLLAAVGVFLIIEGQQLQGFWLLLIAWFVVVAARGAVAGSEISSRLDDVSAADLMEPRPPWVAAQGTVAEAAEEFSAFRMPWAPAVAEDGAYRGAVTGDRVRAALDEGGGERLVAEILEDDAPEPVPPDATLDRLMAHEGLKRAGAVPVVDRDGLLHGLLAAEPVREAVDRALRSAVTATR